MRYALVLACVGALLLSVGSTSQAQQYTQWSAPDTVADGLRMPLDLQVVVDSQGRVHALCSEDFDGNWWPEGVCHWVKEGQDWRLSIPFVHDSALCVDRLAAAIDDQDVLHLLWGITRTSQYLAHSNEVFWSTYQGGKWAPATTLRRAICQDLCLVALPGQRLLAAWTETDPGTGCSLILFARGSEGQWHRPFYALKQFWRNPSPQHQPSLAAGRGDTVHLAFFTWRRDFYSVLYYACKPWDGPWSSLTEIYSHRVFSWEWPVVALTKDGCRHLFWAVDVDPDYDYTPEWLYYSYSRDGKSWSPPAVFSHFIPEERWAFHERPEVAADTTGLLHVVWQYWSVKEPVYFYRFGREESWSEAVPIFSESAQNAHHALTVDRENRLHLLWVTIDEANPDLAVLRHAVGEIRYGTGATLAVGTSGRREPLVQVHAHPNPGNDRVFLQLLPREPCVVTGHVYDVAGRLVETLLEEKMVTCEETLICRADKVTFSLPTGVYFYRLVARPISGGTGPHVVTGKILLVR